MINFLRTKTWISLLTLVITVVGIISLVLAIVIRTDYLRYNFWPVYIILWIASIVNNVKLWKYGQQVDKLFKIDDYLLVLGSIFPFINYFFYLDALKKLQINNQKYIDLQLISKNNLIGLSIGLMISQFLAHALIHVLQSVNKDAVVFVIIILVMLFSFIISIVFFAAFVSSISGAKGLRKSEFYCTELIIIAFFNPFGTIWLLVLFLNHAEFKNTNKALNNIIA